MFGLGGFLSQEQLGSSVVRALSDEAKEITRQLNPIAPQGSRLAELPTPAATATAIGRTATTMGTAIPVQISAPVQVVQAQPVVQHAPAPVAAPAPAKGFSKKKGAAQAQPVQQTVAQAQPVVQQAAPAGAGGYDLSALEAELAAFTTTDD